MNPAPTSGSMDAHPGRALLICNGEQPDAALVRSLAARAAIIVCADGGANAAHELGIRPDLIIGDFDSIDPAVHRAFLGAGVECVHLARQTDTDFEKALLALRERGFGVVDVVGATGLLLDHTLGNLSVVLRHAHRMRITLVDPHYRIDLITRPARFASVPGERISIVPLLPASAVTLTGLIYPLTNAMLSPGVLEATCNEAEGSSFDVRLDDGVLLVFRSITESGRGLLPDEPVDLGE